MHNISIILTKVDRIIPVSGREELRGFQHVFWTRSTKSLVDGHLWFSVITKPARSRFSRVQRLTSVLTVLFTTMLSNIISFNWRTNMDPNEENIMFKLGTVSVTSFSITMGVISAVIAIPVNLLIVILFTKRRIRPRNTNMEDVMKTTERFRILSAKQKNVTKKTEDEEDDDEDEIKMYISTKEIHIKHWITHFIIIQFNNLNIKS